ncbi:LppP/LprE family lipoprotein [Nocardia anaemiae]|uniref:LppP/LprE family lipoprotein n=1 Tax=Nocardia anaemiae TaxID=263910 RepID=UPI000ACB6686|nr:LppP/LprE family lipoprotein [Nocardia anaemiae]
MQMYRLVLLTLGIGLTCVTGCGSGDNSVRITDFEPTTTSPAAKCGVDLTAPVIGAAIATLPVDPITKVPWSTDPAGFEGTYDPCVTLSAVIITVEGATGSSPNQVLLFHKGEFVGTGTRESLGFTALDPGRTTDDTVGVIYKTPGSCNACPDGTPTPVQFHWDGKQVQTIGTPPK